MVTNPAGTFAYVVNRDSDSISMYAVGPNGVLSALGTPVSTKLKPNQIVVNSAGTYAYVTNTGSSSVSMFAIGSDGLLKDLTTQTVTSGANPTGIAIRK